MNIRPDSHCAVQSIWILYEANEQSNPALTLTSVIYMHACVLSILWSDLIMQSKWTWQPLLYSLDWLYSGSRLGSSLITDEANNRSDDTVPPLWICFSSGRWRADVIVVHLKPPCFQDGKLMFLHSADITAVRVRGFSPSWHLYQTYHVLIRCFNTCKPHTTRCFKRDLGTFAAVSVATWNHDVVLTLTTT